MTSYPINYEYSLRDGEFSEGFAATEAEAVAAITAARGDEWDVAGATLDTTEAGVARQTSEQAEADWAKELAAGYASLIHVQGGWKVEITFWRTIEIEKEI